jgi:predicted phage terminase large subunit-like protein
MPTDLPLRHSLVAAHKERARVLGYRDLEPFHDELFEFLDRPGRLKMILLPRGSFKSSLITVNAIVGAVLADPNVRVAIDSEVYRNSVRHLSEIKQHLALNPAIRIAWGDVRTDPGWREDSIVLAGRTRPSREPTVDAMGIDVVKVGMHYDWIVVDDLVSDNNTMTSDMRDKAWDHFQYLFSILEPKGRMTVVGTRWHLDDIYGRIDRVADKLGFEVFQRKAIDDDGNLLLPKRLSREFLDAQRSLLGPYKFAANYQNSPVPDGDRTFQPEWLTENYWTELPKGGKLSRITTVDPAIETDKRRNDYTAIVTCDHDKAGNIWVVDVRRGHWQVDETVDQICKTAVGLGSDRLGIEEVAFQKALRIWVEREFNRRRIRCPIHPLKTSGIAKSLRIERLQPVAARGQLHLSKSHYDLEREMTEYPSSRNDDLLDCLAYQLDLSPVVRYRHPTKELTWEDRFLLDLSRKRERRAARHHMEI